MAILVSIITFFSTLFGGLMAIRLKDKLHYVMAFCAGTVIGAALLELMPEAIEIGAKYYGTKILFSFAVIGFFLYMLLDRMSVLHSRLANEKGVNKQRGRIGASAFSAHSFFDGVAIGFGFQVSATIGIIIAIAVITHDFSDGLTTITVIFREEIKKREAMKWLLIDASTPLFGAISTMFCKIPIHTLGLILAIFTGCFLYIGASDLLPESMRRQDLKWTTALTLSGVLLLYFIIKIAG